MDGQDWTPVVVRTTAKKPTGGAGGGGHMTAEAIRLRRLETEDIPKPAKHLSSESRNDMIRARAVKGMTQPQLNAACAFPLHTIRDIENGKLRPTSMQMNVLQRVLGIVLKLS